MRQTPPPSPALRRRRLRAAAIVALAGLCGVPPAAAQKIFRCTVDGRTVYQQSACSSAAQAAATVGAAPAAGSAPATLERDAEACLAHLKPLLRDPASASVSRPVREGRVLRVTLQAADARGTRRSRDAACEFIGGRVDEGSTRAQLRRLGWLQPAAADGSAARRAGDDSIEAPAS